MSKICIDIPKVLLYNIIRMFALKRPCPHLMKHSRKTDESITIGGVGLG